jgi:hypothetical protein
VRFWVDHATDLIVLGLGAILGVLAAIEPTLRRRPRSSPLLDPASVTIAAPRTSERVITRIIGIAVLAAMIRRALRDVLLVRRGL